MEPTLDQVRHELAEIHEELLSLPQDDFDRRATLRDRQNHLRQLSHSLVDQADLHDAEHLKAAYDRLAQVRDRMLDEQISGASVGDDAVWGEIALSVNRAIDAGNGLDEVEARLQEILSQLRD